MKTSHENISLIENELASLGMLEFKINDDLIRHLCHNVIMPRFPANKCTSRKSRHRAFMLQYNYIRRDLLKIKYKQNGNSAKNITAGFVYAITNPAYPDYIKVGSSIDVYDRLNSYQTSSPFRDYKLLAYFYSENRLLAETEIHNKFERIGEWCKVSSDNMIEVFDVEHKKTMIDVPLNEDSLFNLNLLSTSEKILNQSTPLNAIAAFVRSGLHFILNIDCNDASISGIKSFASKHSSWRMTFKSVEQKIFENRVYGLIAALNYNDNRLIHIMINKV